MEIFKLKELSVRPVKVSLYVPPIVWKGDAIGHIGFKDIFFWVLEGECFVNVDNESYIVRPGQLCFLPKGKRRAYTHVSERFSMYEMAFEAKANGEELMPALGLCENNFVVDIPDVSEMSKLFENSHRVEMYKNPLFDVGWCANIINIIRIYAEQHSKLQSSEALAFKPVLEFMAEHISTDVTVEQLAALVYMQPTYFIKKFSKVYGQPPMAYFAKMRIHRAMGLLAGTQQSIEEIARSVGFTDTSYFARVFKKHCLLTPTAYRAEFKR